MVKWLKFYLRTFARVDDRIFHESLPNVFDQVESSKKVNKNEQQKKKTNISCCSISSSPRRRNNCFITKSQTKVSKCVFLFLTFTFV